MAGHQFATGCVMPGLSDVVRSSRDMAAALVMALAIPSPDAFGQLLEPPASEPLTVEYGYITNSAMPSAGTATIEWDSSGLFGRSGRYFISADNQLTLSYAPTDRLQISFGPQFTWASVHSVSGLPDGARALLGGFGGSLRLGLLDRATNPVGVALEIAPQWRFADEAVRRGTGYGAVATLAIDRELIPGRLFGALNLSYEYAVQRINGVPGMSRGSRAGLGIALASPLTKSIHVGMELRYLMRLEGFGMGKLQGRALYLGPTLYADLGNNWWMSLSWQAQITGNEVGNPVALDLNGFERHQVRLHLGYQF